MEYQTHTLKNGIRIIHKVNSSIIAHAGVFVNVGSRDELESQHGMAHFLEHVFFKGTQKRKSYHIISRLEDVGGELNAYTTKEETCIHASFLREDFDRALELISDILFNSVFPDKELEKEKIVVIDEINSYKDSPSELIFDDFEELVYKNNSIGRNVLGTPTKLKKYNRTHVLNFINSNYCTSDMVISVVGNIQFKKLIHILSKYFENRTIAANSPKRLPFINYNASQSIVEKKTHQAHCVMGNIAYSYRDERRLALHLLNNILGGPGMNSRLNLSLREKYGCCYNVESQYGTYSDTGLFSVYFGTDKANLNKCIDLVYKELERIKTISLSTIQLAKAKKQITGQMAISSENNESLMLGFGKSFMVYNKVDSLQEIKHQIDTISSKQLIEIANEIFDKNKISTLIYR